MAIKNLVSTTTIYGKASYAAMADTNPVSVISNAAASGKSIRVMTLIVSNVNTTTPASVTVSYYTAAALGGTAYKIASAVEVPPNSSVAILDRDTIAYLEEDRSIGVTASVGNYLEAVCFYEEIS